MKPEIWGKYGWCFFHLVTLGYPEHPTEKDKKKYYSYIKCLRDVLPCDKCKKNLRKHLKIYPLTNEALSSRSALIKWGIDLHNIVNYYTGKSMMTYDEAMCELNKLANPQPYNNNFWMYFSGILLGLVLVSMLIYSWRSKK
jgi:hypothetical protein